MSRSRSSSTNEKLLPDSKLGLPPRATVDLPTVMEPPLPRNNGFPSIDQAIAKESDNAETLAAAFETAQHNIGNYELKEHEKLTALFEDDTFAPFRRALFGKKPKETSTETRSKFFDELKNIAQEQPSVDETSPTPELQRQTSIFNALNSLNPNSKEKKVEPKTITMEALLGKKGLKNYQKAIKEEYDSKEFKRAVFVESTKHYEGPTWKDRLVLWIGGPSASGKSFLRDSIVDHVSQKLPTNPESKNEGNFVVSVDGGIEREMSQVRQLVLQLALLKGYQGISDLEEKTNVKKIKSSIQKAALTTPNLHLVIPATFTNLKTGDIKKFAKKKNTTQVFSCITGGDNPERFRRTVERSGSDRAWYKKIGDFLRGHFKINNRHLDCESKIYLGNFELGRLASEFARHVYRKNQPKNELFMDLSVVNDSVYYYRDSQGNWGECDPSYTGPTLRMSARAYNDWQNSNSGEDLELWWDKHKGEYKKPVIINNSQPGKVVESQKKDEETIQKVGDIIAYQDHSLGRVKAIVKIFIDALPVDWQARKSMLDILKENDEEEIRGLLAICQEFYSGSPKSQKTILNKINNISTLEVLWSYKSFKFAVYATFGALFGIAAFYGFPFLLGGALVASLIPAGVVNAITGFFSTSLSLSIGAFSLKASGLAIASIITGTVMPGLLKGFSSACSWIGARIFGTAPREPSITLTPGSESASQTSVDSRTNSSFLESKYSNDPKLDSSTSLETTGEPPSPRAELEVSDSEEKPVLQESKGEPDGEAVKDSEAVKVVRPRSKSLGSNATVMQLMTMTNSPSDLKPGNTYKVDPTKRNEERELSQNTRTMVRSGSLPNLFSHAQSKVDESPKVPSPLTLGSR